MNSTDLTLIQQAAKGSQDAFQSLVIRHQNLIYSLCYRLLSNSAEAEDATQEVFIKLWKNLSAYRSENKLSTWLYRITNNHCLDRLKQQKVKRMYAEVQQARESVDTTDEQTMHTELAHAIDHLIARLPEKQRMVFVLAVIEHQSITEIAEVTGMQKGQVKSNLYYARKQMSVLLKQYYSERQKPDSNEL